MNNQLIELLRKLVDIQFSRTRGHQNSMSTQERKI